MLTGVAEFAYACPYAAALHTQGNLLACGLQAHTDLALRCCLPWSVQGPLPASAAFLRRLYMHVSAKPGRQRCCWEHPPSTAAS